MQNDKIYLFLSLTFRTEIASSSNDFELLKRNLKQAVVFDGRNMYEPDFMAEQGFRYFAIGRGESI